MVNTTPACVDAQGCFDIINARQQSLLCDGVHCRLAVEYSTVYSYDNEDNSPEEDSNNINEDDTSEEIVAFEEDEFLDLHDEAQEAAPPVPVVVPENVPTIEVVPENKLENEPMTPSWKPRRTRK